MPVLLSGEPTLPRSAPPAPEQGVIEEARRRQRSRWRHRGGFAFVVGALAVLLAAIGSAGSSVAGHRHGPLPARGVVDVRDGSVGVLISPQLDGGGYGWCVGIEEPGTQILEGGGCGGPVPTRAQPVTNVTTTASARTRRETIVALVSSQVATVLVDNRRVSTVLLPGLPEGVRVARILLPITQVRSPKGRLGIPAPSEPSLTPLDAEGHVVPSTPAPPIPAPTTTASGPCSLQASGLAGIRPLWSHAARVIAAYSGAVVAVLLVHRHRVPGSTDPHLMSRSSSTPRIRVARPARSRISCPSKAMGPT